MSCKIVSIIECIESKKGLRKSELEKNINQALALGAKEIKISGTKRSQLSEIQILRTV